MLDSETTALYRNTAYYFAHKIDSLLSSEASIEEEWKSRFSSIPLDRTSHWRSIFRDLLETTWAEHGPVVKASMTDFDVQHVLGFLHAFLDFNLFSQVLLNLQSTSLLQYRLVEAARDSAAIEERWAKKTPSPLDPKAKMVKNASAAADLQFNRDLSTLKAMRIIANVVPSVSFRVTPKGSTPALVDSCNLSSLGIGGDQYLSLPEGYTAYYINVEGTTEITRLQDDGTFLASGIAYPFISRSGGDILEKSLYMRYLVAALYPTCGFYQERVVFLPRLTSLLILAPSGKEAELREAISKAPQLSLVVGEREKLTSTT